jgi:L-ribulose-5-phosphate 4-epimerase
MSATATRDAQDQHAKPLELTAADAAVRDELIEAVRELHKRSALPYSGSSNASARLPSGDGVLLASRSLQLDIGERDFAIVDFDGKLVAGWLKAITTPIVGMHTAVYRAHPEVGVVIHTHSPHATSFAVARKPLPLHYEQLLYRGQRQDIPVTDYGERTYTGAVVDQVIKTIEAHPKTRAILLANHGLLAWHDTAEQAAGLVVTIEEAAKIILGAAAIGGSHPMPLPA